MMGTFNCIYETPCGWCSKWDKKCDKKIKQQTPHSPKCPHCEQHLTLSGGNPVESYWECKCGRLFTLDVNTEKLKEFY